MAFIVGLIVAFILAWMFDKINKQSKNFSELERTYNYNMKKLYEKTHELEKDVYKLKQK